MTPLTRITSLANPRIMKVQHLHNARGRKKSGLFFMEGPHLLDALLSAHLLPDEVYYQPELLQRTPQGEALLKRLLQADLSPHQLVEVSERVIEAMSDAQTSQGIISVLSLANFQPQQVQKRRPSVQRAPLLILDDLADPGNMGTILRTALAADVSMVLLTPKCVDCFSPKVVRSAAGAHIALPIETDLSWTSIAERVATHSPQRVLLAEANSTSLYYQQALHQPFALIIGNEAHGPSQEARELATTPISIPLYNDVESLNAAQATAIILYEAVRQLHQ